MIWSVYLILEATRKAHGCISTNGNVILTENSYQRLQVHVNLFWKYNLVSISYALMDFNNLLILFEHVLVTFSAVKYVGQTTFLCTEFL